MAHEWGHNAGLGGPEHETQGNPMILSTRRGTKFTLDQVTCIHGNAFQRTRGHKGSNSQLASYTTDHWFWHASTQAEPYDWSRTILTSIKGN